MRKVLCCIALFSIFLLALGCESTAPLLPPLATYSLTMAEEYLDLDGNQVKILYPVLSDFSDVTREAQINDASRGNALAHYASLSLLAENGGYEYTATEARIMLTAPSLYSVCVFGVVMMPENGNAYAFSYTVNCDLITGAFLEAEDILSDYGRLRKQFLRGKFTQDFGEEDLALVLPWEDMLAQYKDEYGIYPALYFSPGRLGFLIETVSALGDVAGFSIDLRDAKRSLNLESPALAELFG